MPKKKIAKKTAPKKAKKTLKKKVAKAPKKIKRVKAAPKQKVQAAALPKEKLLGKVEHYFDKIMVAAVSVKAPFAVGDILHIKGHTTDFVERLESMQIEHQNVAKVKKGDDVGIKVKGVAREHDRVYLSNEKALTAQPAQASQPAAKPRSFQQPMFPALAPKPAAAPAKPMPPAAPLAPKPVQPKPQAQPKADPYENKKFFSF